MTSVKWQIVAVPLTRANHLQILYTEQIVKPTFSPHLRCPICLFFNISYTIHKIRGIQILI